MNKVKIAALISAIIVFIVVMIGVKNNSGESIKKEDMVDAVIATKQIDPQTVITPDMVEVKKVYKGSTIPGSISNKDQVVGMVTNTIVFVGEPIIQDKILVKDGPSAGLAVKLKSGMRALTLDIKGPSEGIAGLLKPGNFVDIICVLESDLPEDLLRKYDDLAKSYPALYKAVMGKSPSEEADIISVTKEKKAVMLLQRKEVVAVDKIINLNDSQPDIDAKGQDGYLSVTLSVLPDDALKLALAEKEGAIKLIMRPQEDEGKFEIKGPLVRDLLKQGEGK